MAARKATTMTASELLRDGRAIDAAAARAVRRAVAETATGKKKSSRTPAALARRGAGGPKKRGV